jgi:pimeloyl-ACP methyl ester carboxylesterase
MISVNGIELEVFQAGEENAGNPIVLCHGWPELAYSWRHQIPALAAAGYHVIIPNQRGYGRSSQPEDDAEYDIAHLTADLTALLDHYGYPEAVFVGHDWGAMVVWWLTLLHPQRVSRLITLSIPYQVRGEMPWIQMMEQWFGEDHYFVHFNKYPGEADAIFEMHTEQFLGNLFRKNLPQMPPEPGMSLINLAQTSEPAGDPVMSDEELAVFVSTFKMSGFTSSVNWYRNLDRNWHILAEADPIVRQPALMIYGKRT